MATYYFSGKCKWAKLKTAEPEYDKSKNSWRLDLYMDEPSKKLFKESGLQLKTRQDKDGNEFVSFRRATQKLWQGEVVQLEAPHLFNEKNEPIDCLVGNDSEVTIKVSVYNSLKGKGHTLEAVRVDNLKVYEPNKTFSVEELVPF